MKCGNEKTVAIKIGKGYPIGSKLNASILRSKGIGEAGAVLRGEQCMVDPLISVDNLKCKTTRCYFPKPWKWGLFWGLGCMLGTFCSFLEDD